MVFINAALANGSFYLPQRFNNREIKRHPDFIAVGAANTFGHGESVVYSGRNPAGRRKRWTVSGLA